MKERLEMLITKSEEKALLAMDIIGGVCRQEIIRLASARRQGISGIREICLRREGRSSVLFKDERVALLSRLDFADMEGIMERLCDGALYAHRDSLSQGYITLRGGIRVGVGGHAKYEHKSFVGVSDIRSLVFRIPGHVCDFALELENIYRESELRGMLIYSPPGVGKTTALRSLALSLGTGRYPLRVAVIDERCEFDEKDYSSAEVDVLKGYNRRRGLEIATRTLSPEILMVDEIGADDAPELTAVVKCGIPLIATAHAKSYSEICSKPSLLPLLKIGAFSLFVGISENGGTYSLTVDKNELFA